MRHLIDAWIVRPKPYHEDRSKELRRESIVALGFPRVGDLSDLSHGEIRRRVLNAYAGERPGRLGVVASMLGRFVHDMQTGHVVLVPDGDDVYVGELTGGYRYEPTKEGAYEHQRPVRWCFAGDPLSRQELPGDTRRALRAQQPLIRTTWAMSPRRRASLTNQLRRDRDAVGAVLLDPDSDGDVAGVEGNRVSRTIDVPMRDAKLLASKIESAGRMAGGKLRCEACGFDFEGVYGELGRGYAHVHHDDPLSQGTRDT